MSLDLKEWPHCKFGHTEQTYIDNLKVCPNCGYHLRMDAWERVNYIADKDSFEELYQNLSSNNPIEMEGYTEKLQAAKEKTSLEDAVLTGSCTINERKALLGVMSFAFMGGSMGSVVGEKISRLMYKGAEEKTYANVEVTWVR